MCNTLKTKGSIYSLAKLAKERLSKNNYTKGKSCSISTATTFVEYISKQKEETIKKNCEKESSSYDDMIYKKVCEMIENKDVSNPVLSLIDQQVFKTLDAEAKQFYIANLTKKYKIMRARYYKEHPISLYV